MEPRDRRGSSGGRRCLVQRGRGVERLRDLGTALSLANLCFYGVWVELLPGSPHHYFLKAAPPPLAFAAIALLTILSIALFHAVEFIERRVVDWTP